MKNDVHKVLIPLQGILVEIVRIVSPTKSPPPVGFENAVEDGHGAPIERTAHVIGPSEDKL